MQAVQLPDVQFVKSVATALKGYQPFWLQLGLETVLGRRLPAGGCGSDICVRPACSCFNLPNITHMQHNGMERCRWVSSLKDYNILGLCL